MPSPANPPTNPAAVLSAAQRHDLAVQFERAKQLARQTPPDYRRAHRVLSECCTLDPGNTLFVATLLENLQRSQGKTAASWFWTVWQQRRNLRDSVAKKDWQAALAAGWWLAGETPHDSAPFLALARICEQLDHLPTQIQLLQAARQRDPKNIEVLTELPLALAAAGQFKEAAAVWRESIELSPEGNEGKQYLEALSEVLDLDEGNAAPNSDSSLPLKQRVAELISARRWDAAADLLAAEGGAAGADLQLRTLGEEINRGRARHRTEIAERLFQHSAKPAQRRLVNELLEEQRRIELGVAFARYERFPSEPESSWELAACLTRSGNFSEALKYLAALTKDGDWRTRALVASGENWQQLRQFDRALAAYREALGNPQLDPQDEHVQKGWHRAAVLAEASGSAAEALAWLERLVAANPGYKDARARLDKLRGICNKGGFSASPQGRG